MQKQGMTVQEVAEYMGVSKKTIYRLLQSENHPPFLKLGRKIIVRRDKLEEWLDEQEKKGEEI